MTFDWTCPTCSYSNGAYDAWCRECSTPSPEVAPGPRQTLPGGSVDHPGHGSFNPFGGTEPGVPVTQFQYWNDDTALSWTNVRSNGNLSADDILVMGQYGPIFLSDGTTRTVTSRALWRTPVFSLRSDIGALATEADTGQSIWKGAGAGAGSQLAVQIIQDIRDPENEPPTLLDVWASDFGSVWKPGQRNLLTAPACLTQAYLDGTYTIITAAEGGGTTGAQYTTTMLFDPPSNPIRYWQLYLAFDVMPRATFADDAWALTDPDVRPRIRIAATVL